MLHLEADQFVDCSVDEVFDRVCGNYFAYQPVWDPAIVQMVPEPGRAGVPDEHGPSDLRVTVGSRARITRIVRGRTDLGESSVVGLDPGRSITVENRYAKDREQRTISCHPLNGGGTRLHVEITSEVGLLARLIAPLTTSLLERALAISLREIKVAIEDEHRRRAT